MKLTRDKLKKIIKEELEEMNVLGVERPFVAGTGQIRGKGGSVGGPIKSRLPENPYIDIVNTTVKQYVDSKKAADPEFKNLEDADKNIIFNMIKDKMKNESNFNEELLRKTVDRRVRDFMPLPKTISQFDKPRNP